MAEPFAMAVKDGLTLSRRIYDAGGAAVTAPKPASTMMNEGKSEKAVFLPQSPMIYAVISDPAIVDNPDKPTYQPYVYGKIHPPALIPLQMNDIDVECDCYLDTAVVRVSGTWRVHCVMGSRSCDCRIAVPMGEQGSILGAEVEVPRKVYHTELSGINDNRDSTDAGLVANGSLMKPNLFFLTIPQVDGGSNISVKLTWTQKLLYSGGQFCLNIPYTFPACVNPASKNLCKREKIHVQVNSKTGVEVLCRKNSHPFKEVGKLAFLYEAAVLKWSTADLNFCYTVSTDDILGSVLLGSPSMHDIDQREMFSLYLFPGKRQSRKVFKKEVVFVVDISGSMRGKPIEDTKHVLSAALSKLDPGDSFNIIAFNEDSYIFSTKLELATQEAVNRAVDWIGMNFIAGGGTNMLPSLKKAIEMLPNTQSSIPMIFLVTDGTVKEERHICNEMKSHLTEPGSICPRINTFGIGPFCNHYFLQMLAMIGRGYYDAAYDVDSIEVRMEKLLTKGLSIVAANMMIDTFDTLDEVEVVPSHVPDLPTDSPLIISGRYQGKFPEAVKMEGILADMGNLVVDLKTQREDDMPLERLSSKQHLDLLTAQAWFSENKELEEKVAKMSMQSGLVSEYTLMVLHETVMRRTATDKGRNHQSKNKDEPYSKETRIIGKRSLGTGFGDLNATLENIHAGAKEEKLPLLDGEFDKEASKCCGGRSCCFCYCCSPCITICSRTNAPCVDIFTQICTSFTCAGCLECCRSCCFEQQN